MKKNNYKKNYILLLLEGILFDVGFVFFNPSTILPLLMMKLTNSSVMVGMLAMLRYLSPGIFSLISGNQTRPCKYKKKYLLIVSAIGRLPIWILGISLFLINSNNKIFWGGIILFVNFLFWSGDGSVTPVWSDIVGKTILPDQRGRFFLNRQVISGFLSLLASLLIRKILDSSILIFPNDYGIIISISALIFTFSLLSLVPINEASSITSEKDSYKEMIIKIPKYFKNNSGFSFSMITLFFSNLSTIALPFYITYSQIDFNLTEKHVASFVIIQILGRITAGLAYGLIGDKYGHEKSIFLNVTSAFLAPLSIIILIYFNIESAFICFGIAYFFLGFFLGGWVVFINYTIDIIDQKNRTFFVGLINLIKIPTAMAPLMGGVIIKFFDYPSVFWIALIVSAISIAFSLFLPAAPRTKI
jgi:hypothetical protein